MCVATTEFIDTPLMKHAGVRDYVVATDRNQNNECELFMPMRWLPNVNVAEVKKLVLEDLDGREATKEEYEVQELIRRRDANSRRVTHTEEAVGIEEIAEEEILVGENSGEEGESAERGEGTVEDEASGEQVSDGDESDVGETVRRETVDGNNSEGRGDSKTKKGNKNTGKSH